MDNRSGRERPLNLSSKSDIAASNPEQATEPLLSTRFCRRSMLKMLGATVIATSAYELISLPALAGGTSRTIAYGYPRPDALFGGRRPVEIPATIFAKGPLTDPAPISVGPFIPGRTTVADLYELSLDPQRYSVSLYEPYPSPGGNALAIFSKSLDSEWIALYLVFGPREASGLAAHKYTEKDVLAAIDVVFGPEGGVTDEYPFGAIRWVGQRATDGALVYQSKTCPSAYLVQQTGPVKAKAVAGTIREALAHPGDLFLERAIVSTYSFAVIDAMVGRTDWGHVRDCLDETHSCSALCMGCTSSCTGACTSGCTSSCTSGCTSSCTSGCTSSCTSGCTQSCTSCTSCLACQDQCMEEDQEPSCNTVCQEDETGAGGALWGCTVMYTSDLSNKVGLAISQLADPFEGFRRGAKKPLMDGRF